MDPDIKNIIETEQALLGKIEEAKKAARERVEKSRTELSAFRDSEFERIRTECSRKILLSLDEIKSNAEKELEELRRDEERFLDDPELRGRITGRIVSVILEK